MADKVESSRDLKAVLVFADDDTRTVSFKNAQNLTSSDSATVRSALEAFGDCMVGDKTGAVFKEVQTAYIEEKTTTTLDLEDI